MFYNINTFRLGLSKSKEIFHYLFLQNKHFKNFFSNQEINSKSFHSDYSILTRFFQFEKQLFGNEIVNWFTGPWHTSPQNFYQL